MSAGPSETYADIVWKQFRRNVLAYGSLWGLVPLVAVAIFAPAIASSDPWFFRSGQDTSYPWFRSLFTAGEFVDFLFNMSLVAFPAWLVLTLSLGIWWRKTGILWRVVVFRAIVLWIAMTLLLCGLFGGVKPDPGVWRPGATKDFLVNKLQLTAPAWLLAVLFQWPFWQKAGLTFPARVLLAGTQFAVLLGLMLFRYGSPALQPPAFDPRNLWAYALPAGQFALAPWLVGLLAQRGGWEHTGLSHPAKVGIAVAQFLVILAGFQLAWVGPHARPTNRYGMRDFAVEEFQARKEGTLDRYGLSTPIPYGPSRQDLSMLYKPPFSVKPEEKWRDAADWFPHVLGTDDVGRDVLVRIMYGTRVSITVGFVAVTIYLTIGCIVGAVAGYFGGWIDILTNRVIEVVLLFPAFFLILTLVGMLGPNIYIIMFVIGLTGWPTVARLVRGEVLKQRSADYVTAARALGLSHSRIIFQHILPNSLAPALVAAPFGIASAIITEAALSLLGFGVQPPAPTWGVLIKLASEKYDKWWLVMLPTLAIFVTVSIFNLIGSGLRDAMDPRLRSTR